MATAWHRAGGVIHEQCGARGPAVPAFIFRHNWAIWPRGEGHAVAVFCVEGPLRGRRLARAAATDMGLGPISDTRISQVWPARSRASI